MSNSYKDHLAALNKCKTDLASLKGSPVPAGDVSNLQSKLDGMIAELKQYLACADSTSKDIAAMKQLEKKVAPAIEKMNGLIEKMEKDATTAQDMAGKMSHILAKLPAFKKASDAVDACYKEFFGLRSGAVKIKADGNLDL